jgi:LytS/YehU family sensor histidine kinase
MLGWWLAGLVLEKERWRIERKMPSKSRWMWAGMAGTMGFFLAFYVSDSGLQALSQRKAIITYLLVYAASILVIEQADAAKRASFDLLDAREQALSAKLAPHFIFNALNTLHAQIEQDPRGAQATTERLAQLFRQVISASDHLTIPLRQELAFVEAYLGIEQARLGERLRVVIEIPEELESAEVPPLSLQVLVENAVKHGVAPREQGGEVRIGVEKRAGFLHLWVEDPGSGISSEKGTGTALETLRQRLESPSDLEMGLVAGRHRVSFRWREGSGS